MVFADEVFYIYGPPTHLLSVHAANQRLLADRIFLAHAASLRQTSFFARWKFRRFLHSFVTQPTGYIGNNLGANGLRIDISALLQKTLVASRSSRNLVRM